MEVKICPKCKKPKSLSEYGKDKHSKSGFTSQCRKCRNEFNRNSENGKVLRVKYKIENKERLKEQGKEWYNNNKKKRLKKSKTWHNSKKHAELNRKWAKNNKEKIALYTKSYRQKINKRIKERMQADPLYKLRRNLSCRTSAAFRKRGFVKIFTTQSLLGCSYNEAKAHIEKQFKVEMGWHNRGEWHIDHIIPLASAKTEKELIDLCAYTNLQPLWAKENIIKSDKINNKL